MCQPSEHRGGVLFMFFIKLQIFCLNNIKEVNHFKGFNENHSRKWIYSTTTINIILLLVPENLRLFLVLLLDKNFQNFQILHFISLPRSIDCQSATVNDKPGWWEGKFFLIILIYKSNIPREFMGLMFTLNLKTCNKFSQCWQPALTTTSL